MIMVIDVATEKGFIGLWKEKFIYKSDFKAGRDLNNLIIQELDRALNNIDKSESLKGIIVNAGPGSFTGLRVGISVANTLAYTKDIPIVGVPNVTNVDELVKKGLSMVESVGPDFSGAVLPFYGAEPHITKPKQSS